MEELLMNRNTSVTYTNPTLRNATAKIHLIGDRIRSNLFQVAAIIADVDASNAYQIDGFKSVHEWTEKEFGFKSSRSHELLTIGKEWTAPMLTAKSNVAGYCAKLDPRYSTTQIGKMLSTGYEKCAELHESGTISPDMTAKKIGEVLASLKAKETEEDLEEVEDTEEPETVKAEVMVSVVDTDGNEYLIPESVLAQYRKK